MRKKYSLLFLLAILCTTVKAQLSQYYFEAYSGTYTPITGTVATLTDSDEGVTGLLNIGFTFNYNGTDYTQLEACTNGYVKLGATITQIFGSSDLINSAERNVLAPLWDDHALSSINGMRYETSGAAPNRIFTVQWSQVIWDWSGFGPAIEFQLKIYETSNRIEFIYNRLSAQVRDGAANIGINTIKPPVIGSFLKLSNTSTAPGVITGLYYPTLDQKPATGQVYAFFIPQPCSGTPVGGTTVASNDLVCPNGFVKLSVTQATLAKNITYQWQSSPDGTVWTDISGATDTFYTAQQTVSTHYRRAITCGGNTAYSVPKLVNTGVLPITYATLPFTENFEGTWLSNCGLRERPSLSFTNSVPSGDRSWRREDDGESADWTPNTLFGNWLGGSASHSARFRVRDEFYAPVQTYGDLDLHIDCSPAGTKELRFRHIQSQPFKDMSVWYSTDGGANFTLLEEILGWDYWKEQHFVIPSNSATTVIRFRGRGVGYTSASDVGIDDISVQVVTCNFPTGLAITNLQQTTATINWTGEPGAEYEYDVNEDLQSPIVAGVLTTDNQINISGLTAVTNYYLHVRRKCGDGEYSSWSTQAFTTSTDCGAAAIVTCGTPYTFSLADGSGNYILYITDPAATCGIAYGKEKLMKFVPQVTGAYQLKINATNAFNTVYYYIKDAAQGCGPIGWTCLGSATTPGSLSMGTLTAGKEYYILVDLHTIANGHTETIEIVCPAVNPDCVTGSITPAGPIDMCDGNNQLLEVTGGTAWQWYRNGVLIAGATANTYTATQSGKYTVAITNGTCTNTASNTVTINPLNVTAPTLNVGGDNSFCEGGSVLLSTPTVAGVSYQWLKNDVDISGATSETYTASTTGYYTIKVIHPGGCYAVSPAILVTAFAIPAAPTVTFTGSTTICNGQKLTITSSALFSNQWYKDGVLINGATGYTYDATTVGAYTVTTETNGCTSTASLPVTVAVNATPATPVITAGGATTVCTGQTVTLTSSIAAGNQWYKDGAVINSATNVTYIADATAEYKVIATANGCSSPSSATVNVVIKVISPTPSIIVQAPTTFCQGGSVLLQSSIPTGNKWYKNGTLIAGATGATYTATESGNYTVLGDQNGCPSPQSAATTVTVNAKPATPTITALVNVLTSSAATGNQWFKNGVSITGATNKTYTATEVGNYTVQVTVNGCSSDISAVFNLTTTAIVDPAAWNNTVLVYPNPVYSDLFIKNQRGRKLTFRLTDALGRIVYTGEMHTLQGTLSTKKLAKGIYHLLITDVLKNESIIKVIVKQ